MPDFLTRRNGTWHFVRRVPLEFSQFDKRGIVRHSTKVRVSSDRTGRRAVRVAEKLNHELESFWSQCVRAADPTAASYDEVRKRARSLGFEYIENSQLMSMSAEKRLERLEALITARLENDTTARASLLGTQPQPSILLSKVFSEYEELMSEDVAKFSPNQLKVWRNGRMRVVKELVVILIPGITNRYDLERTPGSVPARLPEKLFAGTGHRRILRLICRTAGFKVRYCAEQFENDGSLVAAIMKNIKRVAAAFQRSGAAACCSVR